MDKKIRRLVDSMTYRTSYQRKTDKGAIPACNILGSEIYVGSLSSLLDYIEQNHGGLAGDYLMVSASKELLLAHDDPAFYRCQNGGLLSIPDGGPLKTYGRLHGFKDMERITGPDLMTALLERSKTTGWSHYFYGSSRETQAALKKVLLARYPTVPIAGMAPSLFRKLTKEEEAQIVGEIQRSRADFVWLCLGFPESCYFAARHQGELPGLTISVGAAFDFMAGNLNRAPLWMQRLDLEWLYRIIQEPGRLIGRYARTIPRFLFLAYLCPDPTPSFLKNPEGERDRP